MTTIYSLFETVSVPGDSSKELLLSFTTRKKAEEWLLEKGYQYITHMKCWEKPEEDDYMVWTYVRIEESKLIGGKA